MNDDTPLSAIGDEPVEARIVAWVLGEASGFEAAELERLCEERPELLVFRRRMLALHGLLTEAEAAKPDESWRLPPENRQTLDELFGKEKPKPVFAELQKEQRIRHSGRRALLAIAACVILTLIVAGLFSAAIGGKSAYKSQALMASKQAEMSKSARVSLTTELPPERIEGTPRSIRLPGIASSNEFTLGDENTVASGTDYKPAEMDLLAKNEETKQFEEYTTRDALNPAAQPASPAGPSPEASLAKTKEQQKKRSQISPTGNAKRVFAEDTASSYQIPDPDDRFGEMAKLSSLSGGGGGISGGLGGTGTGMGFGSGSGTLADADAADGSQRQPRPRVVPEVPGTPAPTPAPVAQPQAAKELAGNDGERKTGKAKPVFTPPPTIAPAKPASGTSEDDSLALGQRSGDQALDRVQIDGTLSESRLMAGEKQSLAKNKEKQAADKTPVPGDVPVLGALFARRDKSVTDEQRELNGRDGRDQGKTTVAGGALSFTGSSRFDEKHAGSRENDAAAKSDKSDQSDRSDHNRIRAEVLARAEDGWEKASPADGKSKDTDAKFKLDYSSEYNFKGKDLGQSKEASDSKAQAAQPEITREFTYPTEYEPPELPQGNHPSADSAALRKAIKDQEDKVEDRRKVLSTIVRSKGIIYKGTDSFYDRGGVEEDQGARDALQTYQKLEQDKVQLESQLSSLLKYDNSQLMTYAGGLDLPENTIKTLYPQYQEAKRKLEGFKINGLGDDHPDVRAEKNRIETMKRQLDEGVVNLRATMKAQLNLANERLKSVEAMKNSSREEAIKRGLDAQDYVDAKRDFEADQKLLQQMKQKLMGKSAAAGSGAKAQARSHQTDGGNRRRRGSLLDVLAEHQRRLVPGRAAPRWPRANGRIPRASRWSSSTMPWTMAIRRPTAGEPVAVTIEQAAHPVIPGRNLVRVALKTAAAGRSAAQPLRLTLLVDQSGSMVREDRRAAMDKALAGLAGLLTKNDLVTVIGFARTPRLLADGWTGEQAAKLTDLVNQSASEGGTNLEEAIKLAEQLAERRKLAGAQNRIVLFTDGAANLGDADPARLAAKVKALRQKGIAFDIAGIAADGLNDGLLGELARNGNGRYYVVGKGADENFARQLAGAFRPAAENVKVQVHFNPERVGRYKLIGFEKDRLKTEDFRNDAVDAAELAAEEAGVAIYQVEPLPGGSGELGDVSVRFRDTASGQMVERTWTIPHRCGRARFRPRHAVDATRRAGDVRRRETARRPAGRGHRFQTTRRTPRQRQALLRQHRPGGRGVAHDRLALNH